MLLNGQQTKRLVEGIVESFLPDDFTGFLDMALDQHLHRLVNLNQGFESVVYNLVKSARYGRWDAKLILALVDRCPDVRVFAELAFETSIRNKAYVNSPDGLVSKENLEALLNGDPSFEPLVLISSLLYKTRCVCRVELDTLDGTVTGTGFLISPSMVLTNYHVVEDLFTASERVIAGRCRFDYHIDVSGRSNQGQEEEFDLKNAIVAYSKYSPLDQAGSHPIDADWPSDQLDYAVIKLKNEVGNQEMDSVFSVKEKVVRGWVNTEQLGNLSSPNIVILQHPEGSPLKVAFGFNKLLGLSSNRSRIRYGINTLSGSSGSPCFDFNFRWTGLHNIGDPAYNPTYNQGISARAIMDDLASKGLILE